MSVTTITEVIKADAGIFDLRLKELWKYRDLIYMFVKREFAATYKQTILGPLWFFIQPLLTAVTFLFVFKKFAGVSTNGLPGILFYLSGITIWNYFSECFSKTATVLKDHSALFGKVYFPRLIVPISITISALIRFGIQYFLFIAFLIYYSFVYVLQPNWYILLTPVLLILMAGYALGAGLLFSALTTKYRDLSYLITFGVQLLMFATPVIYSVDTINIAYKKYVLLNPLTPILEAFRFAYLGSGYLSMMSLLYSFGWMIVLLFFGIIYFTKKEQTFADTI